MPLSPAPAKLLASVTSSLESVSLDVDPHCQRGFEADAIPETITTEASHASLLLGISSLLTVVPTEIEAVALDAAEMAAVNRDYSSLPLFLSSTGRTAPTIERMGREAKCTIFLTSRQTAAKELQAVSDTVAALRAVGVIARAYSVPDAHTDACAWLLSAGADRVRLALSSAAKRTIGKATEELEGGYIPLGYLGGKYIAWSNDFAQVQKIPVSSSTQLATLMHLANESWLTKKYPKIERGQVVGFDTIKAGSALRNECARLRGFDSTRVRLTGVWKDGEEWICNSSDAWHASDGAPVERIGEFIYASGADLKITPDTPSATAADGQSVLDFFHTFGWERSKHRDFRGRYSPQAISTNTDTDPLLALGTLHNMYLSAGLDRRPHLFVQADTTSGKSVLTKFFRLALGKAVHYSGGSSGAGLTSKSNREEAHLGMIVEESGHNSSHIESRALYLKHGYEGTIIDKGTTDQTGIELEIRSLCLLVGVVVPSMDKEVMNRINMLKMHPWECSDRPMHPYFTDGENTPNKEVTDLGLRLFARALKSGPRFDRAITMLKKVVDFKGRAANTLVPSMAGSFVFLNDEEMTPDLAQQWADRFDVVSDVARNASVSVGQEVVNFLQSTDVVTTASGDPITMTLGDLIHRAAFDTERGLWRKNLGTHGLRIDRNQNGTPLLGISGNSAGFKRLMSPTQGAKANLDELIRRIDGCSITKTKGSIGGVSETFNTVPWLLPKDGSSNDIEPTPIA